MDLFDEFASAEACLQIEQREHIVDVKARAIARKTSKQTLRRAKTEAVLLDILPEHLEAGMSYHVISHGDVDALSYLIHIMRHHELDSLLLSTWCMAMPDVEWLRAQAESYRIGTIDFVLGEIFPSQYPDEYEACKQMQADEMATLRIARNHAKVMAGCHAATDFYFAIESSSNVNTNPRIEQTAIHVARDLHDFYRDFYAGIKSLDGERYRKRHDKPAP